MRAWLVICILELFFQAPRFRATHFKVAGFVTNEPAGPWVTETEPPLDQLPSVPREPEICTDYGQDTTTPSKQH